MIDRNRCEGKADCVAVCPFDVFEIATVAKADRAQLSLVGRIRLAAHGGQQAYAVNAADCHACGRCVSECPESAITLTRTA